MVSPEGRRGIPLLLGMDIPVIAETPDVLVVDKPHGLPSTPNGRFMRACVQTMLRVRREEPELVAIHRLDRLTGGVLVLSRRPETRCYLQTQFQNRTVHKVYEAVSANRLPYLNQWTRFEVGMTKIPHDPQVKVGKGNGKITETWVRLLGRWRRTKEKKPLAGGTKCGRKRGTRIKLGR